MPIPISEQLAVKVMTALQAVNGTAPYSETFTVVRPTTDTESVNPANLEVNLWQNKEREIRAPYGQRGIKQIFEIVIYVREVEDGDPIDTRMNLAKADAERALMADRRFGGLCYMDSKFQDPLLIADPEKGFCSARIFLCCYYRVLSGNPYALAPYATNEYFWQGNAVLHYARYQPDQYGRLSQNILGPWRRLADLKVIPRVNPVMEKIPDDRDAIQVNIEQKVIGWDTEYEIESEDFSPLTQMLMSGGESVRVYSQEITQIIANPHPVVQTDCVVVLRDLAGNPVYNVKSIDEVFSNGGPPENFITFYSAGTDYNPDPNFLVEGLIGIPPASTIPPNTTIYITFTPQTTMGTREEFLNMQETGDVRFRGRIVWLSSEISIQSVSGSQISIDGEFDFSITPSEQTRENDDREEDDSEMAPSTNKFNILVLSDTSANLGRITFPIGALPAGGS